MAVVQQGQTGSGVKAVLSAITLLHTLGLLDRKPPPHLWRLAISAERLRVCPVFRTWCDPATLTVLAQACSTTDHFQTLAFCILAFSLGLRITEASRLHAGCFVFGDRCAVTFDILKQRPGRPQTADRFVPPYVGAWAAFLVTSFAHSTRHPDTAFTTQPELRAAWLELQSKAGLPFRSWHAWRRATGAYLAGSGAPLHTVMWWCRWSCRATAQLYTNHTRGGPTAPPWTLPLPPGCSIGTSTVGGPSSFWPDECRGPTREVEGRSKRRREN